MLRAFVTGATGFIGSNLVRTLLDAGWEVAAFAGREGGRPGVGGEAIRCYPVPATTLECARIFEQSRPDVVFHLATLYLAEHSTGDIERLVAANILFGAQVAEAMAVCGIGRLVNAGTSWQSVPGPGYCPANLYAATKQAFEDLLAYYAHSGRIATLTLRLFDTYGPHDPRRKVVRMLAEAAVRGEPIDLSPGLQVIDLLHVRDAAAGFLQAGNLLVDQAPVAPDARVYYLPGDRMSLRDLAGRIQRIAGRPIAAHWGARPYRPREIMRPLSVAPDQRLPGWEQRVELDQGLAEILAAAR